MSFGFIKTDRLKLRRLVLTDAAILSEYRSIPDVAKYQSWETYSVKDAEKLINASTNSSPKVTGHWFQFGIEELTSGKLIGDIGFLHRDQEGKSWVGFTIDCNYWRNGFGYEAVFRVIAYYQTLAIDRVWASIDPKNLRSMRLLEKLGFSIVESKSDELIYCSTE